MKPAPMNNLIPQPPAKKELQKKLDCEWKNLPELVRKYYSRIFSFLVLLILVLYSINLSKQAFSPTLKDRETSKSEPEQTNKENEGQGATEKPIPQLGASDCHMIDWKNIQSENWIGLTWFSISNNVWTIRSPKTERDAAIYFNTSCVGGTLVEYEVIPRLADYLNINIYQRGQLRWEIGGGDRRSIELWKNTEGCGTGEIKDPETVMSKKKFLPEHDEILINQPLVIHSALFYLSSGDIRSEVWLTYSSKNRDGEIVTTPREKYFYDFKPGSICDLFHFPDIDQEPYQTGIGLQKKRVADENQATIPPLPKVTFNKFRILPFTYSD